MDTLQQAVAQICPCRTCAAGGICTRVKKITKQIRRIAVELPEGRIIADRYCALCGQVVKPKAER